MSSTLTALDGALARSFESRARQRAWLALAAGVLLGMLLFRLGDAPITRRAEDRTFDVATHMLETGDWVVPVRHGEPRLRKPPLYYWASLATAEGFGGLTLFTHRLPAALAGFALAAVVLAWGRSLAGFGNGAVAAMCLVSMVQFWSLSRRGVAEVSLALFATLALFVFDRIYWGARRGLVPAFFATLLLAFLAKATAALLLVGLPVLLRLLLDRKLGRLLSRDVLGWGLACGVGCIAWYLLVLWRVPEAPALLRESLFLPMGLTESIGSAPHVRPPWFFIPKTLTAAAPAVLLAALVPLHLWRTRHEPGRPRATFPALAFASLFVAFSVFPMKQKHYLMPLLPLLALCIAPALRSLHAERRAALETWARPIGMLAVVVAVVLALLLGLHLHLVGDGVLLYTAVPLLLGVAGLGFAAAYAGCLRALGVSLLLATLLVVGMAETSFLPWRARFDRSRTAEVEGFDAGLWAARFDDHPLLRPIYQAGEWSPGAPPAARL